MIPTLAPGNAGHQTRSTAVLASSGSGDPRSRAQAQFSQRALADKTAATQNFVQTSETGSRRVDLGEFILWAQACGIAPDVALADYLAAASSRKPFPTEVYEGAPAYGTPTLSPAKWRKAKELLHRALKELGEDAQV